MPSRAGPSRSQKASQPSQSQSRARRGTRRDPEEDQEDDAEQGQGDDDDDDQDIDMDADAGAASKGDDLVRRANDLVRLALFTEQKRTPLKRDEISKKGAQILFILKNKWI